MAFISLLISPPGASFPAAFMDVPHLGANLAIFFYSVKFISFAIAILRPEDVGERGEIYK